MKRSLLVAWIMTFVSVLIHSQTLPGSFADDAETATAPVADGEEKDDPAAEEKGDPAEWQSEQDAYQSIQQLMRKKQYKEAIAALDRAKKQFPNSLRMVNLEATQLMIMASDDLPAALERFESLLKALEDPKSGPQRGFLLPMVGQMYAMTLSRAGKLDEAMTVIDRLDAAFNTETGSSSSAMLTMRVTLLSQAGRSDEAAALCKSALSELLNDEKEMTPLKLLSLVTAASAATQAMEVPDEELASQLAQVNRLVTERLDQDDATLQDLSAYGRLQTATAMNLVNRDPHAAEQMLNDVKSRAEAWETEDEREKRQLNQIVSQAESSLSRIGSIKLRVELLGKAAPEINAEHFVNGDEVTLADLKGKVVLLDFWAVWCGPCIATFPHLRHLHETYADDGLVILGVTRPYGYRWDEDGDAPTRSADATIDEELAMLEKFRQQHELPYAFAVTAKDADTTKRYAVSGIPQVVVIDQEGLVQLIEVGSSENTARSVAAMIDKLLKEPE